MTTPRSLPVFGFAAAALIACGEAPAPSDTAPAPVSLVGVEAAHYAIVRVDDGVLYASRVGATKTLCGDRSVRRECVLGSLDLSRLDLSPEDEQLARAHIVDGTAIVRAKLAAAATAEASTLVATSVWVRRAAASTLSTTRASTDAVFTLRDVHEACDAAADTCAWLRAEPISGGRTAHYSNIDTSLVGGAFDDATKDSIARGETLAHGASVGSRFIVASVYVPFGAPAPAPAPSAPSEPAPIN